MHSQDWNSKRYTKEEFIKAWNSSNQYSECARKLGLTSNGKNASTFRKLANELNLPLSHYLGREGNKGKSKGAVKAKKPLEQVLVYGQKIDSSIKSRIIREGLLEQKCYAPYCQTIIPTVNAFTGEPQPLKFVLDHINGNNLDSRIENLRLLCNNCNAQAPTHCVGLKVSSKSKTYHCRCGNLKTEKAKTCKACSLRALNGDIVWPSIQEILEALRIDHNYAKLAKQIGVTDTAVPRHIKRHGYNPRTLALDTPPPDEVDSTP